MKLFLFLLFFLFLSFSLIAQPRTSIRGYLTDQLTGESLVGAHISIKGQAQQTASNNYGFFNLGVKGTEPITLSIQYLGYATKELLVNPNDQKVLNISLTRQSILLSGVEIQENQAVFNSKSTYQSISAKQLQQFPTVFGDADVLKVIQLQSGVKTVGDGSSGMFVRGGRSDENLIILDEAPVYNPTHIMGYVSAFNADAINHIKFYKGSAPANYGGRVAGVLDMQMKEGNLKNYELTAGINLIGASVLAGGPIKEDQSSFLLSGRKSMAYAGGLTSLENSNYHDFNAKFNWKISDHDRFYFSMYYGKDHLNYGKTFGIDGSRMKSDWGNQTATARWTHHFANHTYFNSSLIYSNYDNLSYLSNENFKYELLVGIRDINYKMDFGTLLNEKHHLKYGFNTIYHQFVTGQETGESDVDQQESAWENAFYMLDELQISSRLKLNVGLRLSSFHNLGQGKDQTYYDERRELLEVKENVTGIYHSFVNLEPRISGQYEMTDRQTMKFGYDRNVQYMQVLNNSSMAFNSMEMWFPANQNIDPIIVDALSFGWFYRLNASLEFSAETYFKAYQNVLDYKGNAQIVGNDAPVTETLMGKGRAYGFELALQKIQGKLTGMISYSYARVFQKINGINDDQAYVALHDIPHDFRAQFRYALSKRWHLNGYYQYQSGRPVTLPIDFYRDYITVNRVPIYGPRNGGRFPDYQRMDLSVDYERYSKFFRGKLTFGLGIYNAFGTQNPMGIEYITEAPYYKTTHFLGAVPQASFKYTFE